MSMETLFPQPETFRYPYLSAELYYNMNMELLKKGLYTPKEIGSGFSSAFTTDATSTSSCTIRPFYLLPSFNNDPFKFISYIAKCADGVSNDIGYFLQYYIIPTDYFYATLADGYTYRFRIADKNHYATKSFTKTHYTVIADELWSSSISFAKDATTTDYSVSDLRKAYQTDILNQFAADQQAAMITVPVSSYDKDGTAVLIEDKIYPMSNFEMFGSKGNSKEEEVLPGGTESPNWHFESMYRKSDNVDLNRLKSSFGVQTEDLNGSGNPYWLRSAASEFSACACVASLSSSIFVLPEINESVHTAPSICFNLG